MEDVRFDVGFSVPANFRSAISSVGAGVTSIHLRWAGHFC